MSTEYDQHLASGVGSLDLSGNNRTRPQNSNNDPPTLFSHLDDPEQETLLRESGYLYGFLMDNHDGPRRSARQVAKITTAHPVPTLIQEQKNLITKVLSAKTDRDANFAHQGWSASSMSVITPWIASRIAKHNRMLNEDSWITKRMVVQRLSVNLSLEELEPDPEFEKGVLLALGKPSRFKKFQMLDLVFRLWGDVIPLVFDLGVSLSVTDLKANYERMPAPIDNPDSPYNLTVSRTAEINTQGGEVDHLPGSNAAEWLSKTVQPHSWRQVRVVEVASVVDLLKPKTKNQIVELYSTLLSYCPSALERPIKGSQYFGGSANGLRTICRLEISSGEFIDALRVVYLDGTLSDGWHEEGGAKHIFELNSGEHITEVMVWSNSDWVSALQFTTSNGRVSPHYGGAHGTPTIMSAEDGVLAGFSGSIKSNSVSQIQTIWRHDVLEASPSQNNRYFEYFGGTGGTTFSDRSFISSPRTHISSIRIGSSTQINGLQVAYINNDTERGAAALRSWRGQLEGEVDEFQLDPGEYIVRVQGRHSNLIIQLCFVTNKGRVSKVCGGGEGVEFCCEPPRRRGGNPMGLNYIAGRHGYNIDGLLFVWGPVAQAE